MKAGSLKAFFGKDAEPVITKKPEPSNKPSGTPTDQPAPDIEKELINEIKQDEKSETIGAGKVPGTGPETFTANSGEIPANGNTEIPGTGSTFQVVIGGRMLLYGCDAIFPKLIVWGAKRAGYKTDKKLADFILTEDEIKMMEPSAGMVAEELFSKMSPMVQFCGMMTMIYAKKL